MRPEKHTYYFSVEGETEKWYLEWLQDTINARPDTKFLVKLDSKVEKNPVSYVKRLTVVDKAEITHVFDYESNDPEHVQLFQASLDSMKKAQISGKKVKYRLGYSNFTFELWIILHKAECSGPLTDRKQYLDRVNRAYDVHFVSLGDYKTEDNFKGLLSKLTLEDVHNAIRRSKAIMEQNQQNGYSLQTYKGYKFYRENPSFSVWEIIEQILTDCGL